MSDNQNKSKLPFRPERPKSIEVSKPEVESKVVLQTGNIGKKSKKVLILSIICSVLVIALVGIGAYWFFGKPKEYTITYLDADFQSVYQTTTIKEGETLLALATFNSNDPNLVFEGWYLEDSFINKFTAGIEVNKDYIIYPKVKYEYTITYKDINLIDVYDTQVFDKGEVVVMPAAPTHTNPNLIFKGWYTDSEFTNRFVFGQAINQNYTLYPLFISGYIITYKNVDLTSTYLSREFNINDVTVEPTVPTHSNEYAVFKGWYTDTTFTHKFVFGTTINQDYTLYPLFEVEYKITYKASDLITDYKVVTLGEGELTVIPEPPTHINPNAEFVGWYSDSNFENLFTFGVAIDRHYTLYPLFEVESQITYKSSDLITDYKVEIYETGDVTVEPTAPTHSNEYAVFKGWYTDTTFTHKFVFGTTINQDYTLYPLFEVEYKITYKASDLITDYKVVTLGEGELTVIPEPPTHVNPNAEFVGWYSDSNFENLFTFGVAIDRHYTLYPLFEIEYQITYKASDLTTDYKVETYEASDVTAEPVAPTHTNPNAEFAGWYSDNTFENKFVFGTTINQDYTLYPLFENLDGLAFSEIKDGNQTVIGYSVSKGVFTGSSLIIPSTYKGLPVIEVADNAFINNGPQENTTLEFVKIPDSVVTIGDYAFFWCSNLQIEKLSSSLEHIGDGAFYWCSNIAFSTLPNTIVSIGEFAFADCAITINSLPSALKTIGQGAFSHCEGVTITSIPNGVESIGGLAFSNCSGITSISIPASVTSLSATAFTTLNAFEIDDGNTVYNDGNGSNCLIESATYKLLRGFNVTAIPSNVKIIASGALSDVVVIDVPSSVESIENDAFKSIKLLNILGDSLTLQDDMFSNLQYLNYILCQNDSMVTILQNAGASYTAIYVKQTSGYDSLAFASEIEINETYTIHLDTITDYYYVRIGEEGSYEYYKGIDYKNVSGLAFSAIQEGNEVIAYSVAKGEFSGSEIDIPSIYNGKPVTAISDLGFKDLTTLTSIGLPSSLTRIGSEAFSGCTKLALTSLPDGIVDIGEYAFSECTKLELTSLPSGLTVIETRAFSQSGVALTSLPEGLVELKAYCLNMCPNLALTSLPSTLQKIGERALSINTKVCISEIPHGVTTIGVKAFLYATGMKILSLPSTITSIESEAFKISGIEYLLCPNIAIASMAVNSTFEDAKIFIKQDSLSESITFTNQEVAGVTIGIGQGEHKWVKLGNVYYMNIAEEYSEGLEFTEIKDGDNVIAYSVALGTCTDSEVVVPSSYLSLPVTAVTDEGFSDATITSIQLPNTIEEIGQYAFWCCYDLVLTSLPNSIKTIKDYAFDSCYNIELTWLPTSLVSLGESALCGCKLKFTSLPSTLEVIGDYALSYGEFKYLTIPGTVKEIGYDAFSNNSKLRYVFIDDGVESIMSGAFGNCENLKFIFCESNDVADKVKEDDFVSTFVFVSKIVGFEGLTFPGLINLHTAIVVSIDTSTNYEWVRIGEAGNYTYYQRAHTEDRQGFKFTQVIVDDYFVGFSVAIGSHSYSYVEIPSTFCNFPVVGISENGFANVNANIILPSTIEYIYDGAFNGSNIAWSSLPSGLKRIGSNAFKDTKVTFKSLPEGVETIGEGAFSGCTSITVMVLNQGLSSVSNNLFSGCTSLTYVYIPETVLSVGTGVFTNCSALVTVICESNTISTAILNQGVLAKYIYVRQLSGYEDIEFETSPVIDINELIDVGGITNAKLNYTEEYWWIKLETTEIRYYNALAPYHG